MAHENSINTHSQDDLLQIKNLKVNYGSIKAIKDISFAVKPGQIVSLVGANGAGKTTTLKAISGLLPFEGSILYKNQNLQKIKPEDRVRMGIAHAPEGRGVFAPMSVFENLELGAHIIRDKNKKQNLFNEIFHLFPRLKERQNQLAGTLSGGEQQMLAIARALLSEPELLLLDEPSLGLAPLIVAQIFEVIKKLNQEKKMTVLLIEQNARMALKLSHEAYVLETGYIRFSGSGQELLNNEEVQKSYLGM